MKINNKDKYGNEKKGNRNFGERKNQYGESVHHGGNIHYGGSNHYGGGNHYGGNTRGEEKSSFKLKNSLIITPYYEVEFELGGGIRYVKNHRNEVLLVGDRFNIFLNDIKKMPLLEKREIIKHTETKKIIIREEYNFDGLFLIYHDVSLYCDKNRIDVNIRFKMLKDIYSEKNTLNSVGVNYSLPEVANLVRHKSFLTADNKYNTAPIKENISVKKCKWINFECGESMVTVNFNEKTDVHFKSKYLSVFLSDLNSHGFSFVFSDKPFNETLISEY